MLPRVIGPYALSHFLPTPFVARACCIKGCVSTRRRSASERDGRSGCLLHHSSSFSMNSSDTRICIGTFCVRPAGRPGFRFETAFLAIMMKFVY
jgi:hypothetical protein